jgi:dTDP-glucose 4,6-dehydratase
VAEKFLILGVNSFYGSNFAEYVEKKGDVVEGWVHRLEDRGDESYCDADYVVNFASQNIVAESWERPDQYAETNLVDTTALIETLRHSKIKKFVHVSTPESYGHTEGWVDETYATWSPSTPYGVSRAAMDMMLMAYFRAYRFPAVITRTANIYGSGQPKHRLVPLVVDKLFKGEKIQLHGGGNTLRCFVHVKDACAATYLAAKQGSAGQTYHISSTTPVTVANVVHNLCRIMGKNFASCIENAPDRPGKDHAYLLKSERLRIMGWKENYTLERGLQECVLSA